MSGKKRLDVLVFEQGLTESRERARTTIMSGLVFVNGQRVDKPGTSVSDTAEIEVRGRPPAYVSRGGLKLERALDCFGVSPEGKVAIDIGASTGGFTDCLLKRGAAKVYAVDVGYGQLAWSLRSDPRVVCMDRTNIRYVEPARFEEEADIVTADVSFISLRLVLPVIKKLLKADGEVICLVKPQFEAGRENVGKKGVVKDPDVHTEVLRTFIKDANNSGFTVKEITYSPIMGPEGNIEFLAHLVSGEGEDFKDAEGIVTLSHEKLRGIKA